MEDEQIIISKTKVKLTNPKNPQNIKDEEQKESSNMNDPNSKTTKLQEDNINGNYSRIYIQEGQKKSLVYEEKEEVPPEKKETILKDASSKEYNKVNEKTHNTRYSTGLYKNKNNKNTKLKDGKNNEYRLKRQSLDRGGDYKNVRVTHIIDSTRDIDFHIIEPLDVSTEESRNRFKIKLNKKNRNGKNGNVKVNFKSSCDNIKITSKEKKKIIGKIEHVPHRENPQLKKINAKKVNKTGSSSMTSNKRYSKPLNKNVRK